MMEAEFNMADLGSVPFTLGEGISVSGGLGGDGGWTKTGKVRGNLSVVQKVCFKGSFRAAMKGEGGGRSGIFPPPSWNGPLLRRKGRFFINWKKNMPYRRTVERENLRMKGESGPPYSSTTKKSFLPVKRKSLIQGIGAKRGDT